MVADYVDLVGLKMTVKERAARKQTVKNFGIDAEIDTKS